MNTFVVTLALLSAVCCPANAKTVVLKGAAADDFISKYLPDAEIPGPVKAVVSCNVPAMGARSDGEVSRCVIKVR